MHIRTVIGIFVGIGLAAMSNQAAAEERSTYTLASLPMPLSAPFASAPRPDVSFLDQLAHTYTTPKAVAEFLQREFTFQRDQDLFGEEDHWQSPEEFTRRKAGDCEDYALLARELLKRNWITAYIFSLFGEGGYAHTVCVFVDPHGLYNVINQGQLRSYRAKSLEAVASAIYPGWTSAGLVEQDGTRGRFVKEITNSDPVMTDGVGQEW